MKTMHVPPDGGYGWVIVFASVLNNFLMVPLIQNVVLIFKDKMERDIDMTITQMWFALNVHTCFGQIIGLVNNTLLTRFGYRKVALSGVTFVFFGLSMSSWIDNYAGFMLTFGLVTALGVGLNTSSYTLAIKSYFMHNQNNAIGLSMTLTALGPILMPQIIKVLILNYDPDGVILILAGIIAHGYIAAGLLQPVKKHMVKVVEEEEEVVENETKEVLPPIVRQYQMYPPREYISNRRFPGFRRKDSVISISYEQEQAAIMGLDSTLGGSLYSLESIGQRRSSSFITPQRFLTKTTWWKSEESINLQSCIDLFNEQPTEKAADEEPSEKKDKDKQKNSNGVVLDKNFHFEEHKIYSELSHNVELPWYKRWMYQIVDLFGLDLFFDLRYVNIMTGMSLAILTEMNFTVMLPFLLFEYSLTITEIAAFLSILGAADILFRFLAPHIGDWLQLSVRVMLMLVLGCIIVCRIALVYIRHYPTILLIAFILGCVKGLRVVYSSLVIPSYVPKERLASASAIQIIVNSLMSLVGGHFIGVIRTDMGSYTYCLMFFDCLLFVTIVLWTADILFKKCRRKLVATNKSNFVDVQEIY